MPIRLPSICDSCKREHREGVPREFSLKRTCDAFPEGIPWPYLSLLDDHSDSTGTDNGLTYLEDPEREDEKIEFYLYVNSDAWQAVRSDFLIAAGEAGVEFTFNKGE